MSLQEPFIVRICRDLSPNQCKQCSLLQACSIWDSYRPVTTTVRFVLWGSSLPVFQIYSEVKVSSISWKASLQYGKPAGQVWIWFMIMNQFIINFQQFLCLFSSHDAYTSKCLVFWDECSKMCDWGENTNIVHDSTALFSLNIVLVIILKFWEFALYCILTDSLSWGITKGWVRAELDSYFYTEGYILGIGKTLYSPGRDSL